MPPVPSDETLRQAVFPRGMNGLLFAHRRRTQPWRAAVRVNLHAAVLFGAGKFHLQTLHERHVRGGVVGYDSVVVLTGATFHVSQHERARVVRSGKRPMAAVHGLYGPNQQPCWDGVVLRFNPHHSHLFTTEENHWAVAAADQVTICNHRVYAQGVVFYDGKDWPAPVDDAPSNARLALPG